MARTKTRTWLCNIENVSTHVIPEIRELTLEDGWMWDLFETCRYYHRTCTVCFYKDFETNEIQGWGLVGWSGLVNGLLLQVYVDPAYRYKGIGTKITVKLMNRFKSVTIWCSPWDDASEEFFKYFRRLKPLRM